MEFVLVHGTTQSPAGWEPLRSALTRRGHACVAVDLPNGPPALSVEEYARLAAEQVGEQGRARVVVGHSGSGVLLPAIAAAVNAEALAWLAAYVPDFTGGRSLFDEFQAEPTALFHPDWLGVNPVEDEQGALRFLFHDCSAETARWALGTLREFAPQSLYTHTPAPGAPGISSVYIVPTADRTLRPQWMHRAAVQRLGARPIEIDAGHCPHVSSPEATADALQLVEL